MVFSASPRKAGRGELTSEYSVTWVRVRVRVRVVVRVRVPVRVRVRVPVRVGVRVRPLVRKRATEKSPRGPYITIVGQDATCVFDEVLYFNFTCSLSQSWVIFI